MSPDFSVFHIAAENVKRTKNSWITEHLLLLLLIQARIAQLVAYQLGTEEIPGSNPGKGENFSMKISN